MINMRIFDQCKPGETCEMPIEYWEGHLPKGYHISLGSGIMEMTGTFHGRVWNVIEVNRERGVAIVKCSEWVLQA